LTRYFHSADDLARFILDTIGHDVALGLPLGLGKANDIANALFARAVADPQIQLRIFSALTLEKPPYRSQLERRFLEPIVERLFGGYPALQYAHALRHGGLPANITVNEFFFLAGRWLFNARAQQDYISSNYTHAVRLIADRGVNVIAQLVAKKDEGADARYSLSCNTDVTLDALRQRAQGASNFLLVGQVNSELPFMAGEAEIPASEFAAILDDPSTDFPLFAPPKEPVSLPEYAAGFHIARLIPDGGTLQIGIGGEGDAAIHALVLRHKENDAFRQAVAALAPYVSAGHTQPFSTGLYACTEMLVDGLLNLYAAGVLKREIDGAVAHAGFFVGPKSFYRTLREMPEPERAKFKMRAISFTNALYGEEAAKRAARADSRFVNNAMVATLLGEAASDTLENGRVVSGVGGQHDFAEQAFALDGARSILAFKATRKSGCRITSNVRSSYSHITIPRHLRDIFISEYGVADLRGRTDAGCIAAMLNIADSRFQPELMREAKDAGKLPRQFEIPAANRDNTPERIARALAPLQEHGLLPLFPLGTDLTPVEQRLVPALASISEASQNFGSLTKLMWRGLFAKTSDTAALDRLGLANPVGLQNRVYRLLLKAALQSP
jgi:acyl-CoA hydrolase